MMLACELKLAGVDPVIIEQLPEPSPVNKANGLVGRVVPMLHRRGLYQRLAGSAEPPAPVPAFFFAALPFDLTTLDDNPLHVFPVPQTRIEKVLNERAAELGVIIHRSHELVGLTQCDDHVELDVRAPTGTERMITRYLVGADGAHSVTRKLAGIDFPGSTNMTVVSRIAEVDLPPEFLDADSGALTLPNHRVVPPGYHRTEHGVFAFARFVPSQPILVLSVEWSANDCDPHAPLTIPELRSSVHRVLGIDVPFEPAPGPGPHRMTRSIGVNTRLAGRYINGRVLLAGDAAHVHFVVGGPGLNLGLQDAINLGWKLAATCHGWAPPGLLDTYQTERHPVGQRVMMQSQAQLALLAPGTEVTALRELFGEMLRHPAAVAHIATTMAGADIRYDMGEPDAHQLVGGWAPDLSFETENGPRQLSDFTATGHPLLLDFTDEHTMVGEAHRWRDRITTVAGRTNDDDSPTCLLLRPDCYVAWATDSPRPTESEHTELSAALSAWFGQPR
jgi:2-polyprenyl-6-methoxyphenol hydroxylase-like FAD-dependent oxidoreductase